MLPDLPLKKWKNVENSCGKITQIRRSKTLSTSTSLKKILD